MNQRRVVWSELIATHKELASFPLALLAHHLSLILHFPIAVSQAKNLKRRGVIIWRGFLPKVAEGLNEIGRGIFAEIYAACFEREEDRGKHTAEDCTLKGHAGKDCVAVTFTHKGKKTVSHMHIDIARKQFHITEENTSDMEVISCSIRTHKADGLRIAKGATVRAKRTFVYIENEGARKVDGMVRRSLNRVHSTYSNAIVLRRFWGGLRQPLPIFTVKDIEQSLAEYVYLAMCGMSENKDLTALVQAVMSAKKGKSRSKAIGDLSAFLCNAGKNLYLSMLHKETAKVWRYTSGTDFVQQLDGVCSPYLLHASEESASE
jgi:hypothetical protein